MDHKKGTTARNAAGKIHTDLERGFIRAEVIAFDDLKESGSISSARSRVYLDLKVRNIWFKMEI